MSIVRSLAVAVVLTGSLSLAALPADAQKAKAKTQAQCVNKAGQGTNTTEEGAKSQAFEIILQTTDLGSWTSWMVQGQPLGKAPGYAVRNLRFKCGKGGIGYECRAQATLCQSA
jgi:hypothetical protein